MSFLCYVLSTHLFVTALRVFRITSHPDACLHHVVVEGRPAIFGHEDWLDEQAHFVAVLAQRHGGFEPLVIGYGGYDDGHVDVAPLIWVALAVGAEHHDLGLAVEAGHNYLLVSSDEVEGLIAAEHSWSIHCCICLVCSTICRVLSSPRVLAMLRL